MDYLLLVHHTRKMKDPEKEKGVGGRSIPSSGSSFFVMTLGMKGKRAGDPEVLGLPHRKSPKRRWALRAKRSMPGKTGRFSRW
jgi:hypothetical protein